MSVWTAKWRKLIHGTQDSYGSYEHVYCVFTVQMTTMTVSSIVLGLSR